MQTCSCNATINTWPSNERDEPLSRQRNELNERVTPFFSVHILLLSRMVNSRFFFAQGRSLHQRAAHRDPKRGPLPSAPPVQEQALHPHSGEAQMGQVQADLQVFTLLQTLAWAGNCKRRLFQMICNLTVVKLHFHLKHTGQNEALRPRVQILPASS